MTSKKNKKDAKLEEKAAKAVENKADEVTVMPDVTVSADDDFEEFAPVDINSLGD